MNFKNKYLLTTIRILFGLFLLFSGVSGYLSGDSMQGIPEPMIESLQALKTSGLFHMIKVTEIVAGLMLIFNFLPALAAIFIGPIAVGIVIFNAMLTPQYLISGAIVGLPNAYLGYVYWDKYKALFTRT